MKEYLLEDRLRETARDGVLVLLPFVQSDCVVEHVYFQADLGSGGDATFDPVRDGRGVGLYGKRGGDKYVIHRS